MCEYCLPLQPYDAKYLDSKKIKFMSLYGYIKKIMENNQISKPLIESDFKVKNPCPSGTHPPYPAGICTKCQPSSIILTSQTFRSVDHVEFEAPKMIDSFLSGWRQSGVQRFGYLYGKVERYDEVPLGIKVVVSAIYEPVQEGWGDGIQVDVEDARVNDVDAVAAHLGLQRVGMIYTDLTDDGSGQGKVICKRHSDSFFLSSAECISSASMQHSYPTPCKYSESGYFGSRFVTCVLSGIFLK
jgi:nuclear protein localization family protein 4